MQILEKHVLKSYLASFVFCITMLIVVGVIGDIFSIIEDIFKHNISLGSIFGFYFYLGPFAFVNMLPFACLLAAVYVFNSLSKHHEITAVIASGISLWKLLKPVMAATFILCVITFIVSDKIVPPTLEKANTIKRDELEAYKVYDTEGPAIRDLAVYADGGQIIFAQYFYTDKNILKNLIIDRQDDDNIITEKVSAREVMWVPGGNSGGYWEGTDVMVFQLEPSGAFRGDPAVFKKKIVRISETPEVLRTARSEPALMSYAQLQAHIGRMHSGFKDTVRRLEVDLYYKLAFPFMAMVTVLIGVPFSIETGRGNALVGIAKGIAAGVAYLPFVAVSLALGKGGYIRPEIAPWLAMAIFCLAGIYLVNRKS